MRQIYSFVQIWRYIYYSKHALSNKPSFPRCSGFPASHAFKNLHQTHVRKCKNAMPKSRQNLSSLLSIVDYMFFNLFLVVHLRKKYYFGKEKQYSTQNSVFLERFYRKSGSPDSLYGKCRNDFDMPFEIEIPCILLFLNRTKNSQNSPKRMHPYYMKFSRHVYLVISRCAYFATLKFRDFAKILYYNYFNFAFLS